MATVSIIIPAYNQELYVKECLLSAVNQTFQDIEIIVVNDGSADQTLQIITEFMQEYSQVQLINQKNQGVVAARNAALAKATGEYIFPLDADDIIVPTCIEKLYRALEETSSDVIYSDVEFFGDRVGLYSLPEPTFKNMVLDNCITCSALYKREHAIEYGGYDLNMNKGLEDYEFWWNFLRDKKKFYKVPEILVQYRIRENSRNKSCIKREHRQLKRYIRKKHKLIWAFLIIKVKNFFYSVTVCNDSKQYKIKICKIPIWYRTIK